MNGAVFILVLRGLFAISLFAFLGWISYVLWKDLRQTIKSSTEYQIPAINLLIHDSGISYSFNQPEIFIGRDPQADLHIPDDTLSGIHARVFYKNNQWMVEDLQSTNGTQINEERLSTPSVLIDGDEMACGRIRLHVHLNQG
jgi:pSer/pThr/pTyr-binding forkhead associated (FHA) protein